MDGGTLTLEEYPDFVEFRGQSVPQGTLRSQILHKCFGLCYPVIRQLMPTE
jgi:hypothetical protein